MNGSLIGPGLQGYLFVEAGEVQSDLHLPALILSPSSLFETSGHISISLFSNSRSRRRGEVALPISLLGARFPKLTPKAKLKEGRLALRSKKSILIGCETRLAPRFSRFYRLSAGENL